jgi:hypothetical protein
MDLAIHIYHLDNDEEADEIVHTLESLGIGESWTIERPTNETNAIFVHVGKNQQLDKNQRVELYQEALELIHAMDKKVVEAIKARDLRVALRITTSDFYISLPEDLVSACGILGLQICIFNTKAFKAGI